MAKIDILSQIDIYSRSLDRDWLKNLKYFGLKYNKIGSKSFYFKPAYTHAWLHLDIEPPQKQASRFFLTKLSRNLSWTHVSGVGQQIWVWGSSGRQYKITMEKVKNSNKQKI